MKLLKWFSQREILHRKIKSLKSTSRDLTRSNDLLEIELAKTEEKNKALHLEILRLRSVLSEKDFPIKLELTRVKNLNQALMMRITSLKRIEDSIRDHLISFDSERAVLNHLSES